MRRTIYVPEGMDKRIHEAMEPGETYSAALLRLVDAGLAVDMLPEPSYFNSMEGDDLPEDLGLNYEKYMFMPPELWEKEYGKRSQDG
jgi:hypothetical protein